MFGGTLALLTRSLRVDARMLRTHLFRVGFAGFICMLLWVAHLTSLAFGAPGLQFFQSIIWLNIVLIVLAGVSFFATAITEEKEEETLGLLKMAGISHLGILLGKSTTRLIGAVLLLLVQFPFTLLAITLGGVTLAQVLAAYLSVLSFMLLLANVALLSSVVCRRSGNAAGMTLLLLAAYIAVPLLAPQTVSGLVMLEVLRPGAELTRNFEAFAGALAEHSVFAQIGTTLQTGFDRHPVSPQVVSHLLGALAFFIASWLAFDRFTRDGQPAFAVRLTRRARASRSGMRRAWQWALVWKDFYFITGGTFLAVVKTIIYGLIVVAIGVYDYYGYPGLYVSSGFRWDTYGDQITAAMLAVLVIELSLYSSRIFHDEVKGRTFETLFLLPESPSVLAYQKAAGCLLGILPAVFWLCIGAALSPENFLWAVANPFTWYTVVLFAAFLHLTALYSLMVKWGALPLAIGTMFVSAYCCPVFWLGLMVAGAVGEHQTSLWARLVSLLLILLFGAVLLIPMQVCIRRRLEFVATQS